MTKEEAEIKEILQKWELIPKHFSNDVISEALVFDVAAEYAKQQDIAFGYWLYSNYTQCDITNGWVERAKPLSKNALTTEQVHEKFIEQQNKL